MSRKASKIPANSQNNADRSNDALTLYGIAACDTCRKAKKALNTCAEVEFVDVRETPLPAEQIARFLSIFGEDLVNRRSTTWRGLSEAERQAPAADLLAAHPTLMKRPVIEGPQGVTLGWSDAVHSRHAG